MIAILEDDERRQQEMKRLLATWFPERNFIFFDNAPDTIVWLVENLAHVSLLCLDHDLGASRIRDGERFEPGVGRDVVNFLADRTPRFPVIVHSSNPIAAPGMIYALEAGSWSVVRVVPFDDLEWLAISWLKAVTAAIETSPSVPNYDEASTGKLR